MTDLTPTGAGPYLRAYIWWCGDEVCDCTEPRVELLTRRGAGPFWNTEILWTGTFHSGWEPGQRDAQDAELLAECERRGIPLGLSKAP